MEQFCKDNFGNRLGEYNYNVKTEDATQNQM